MLAKSRSDRIARRAALSAPSDYLPRLLMCSGLPRASLVTMIDRLGHLGDTNAEEKGDVYRQLLESCASREFDREGMEGTTITAKKLLGRVSAYIRLFELPFNVGPASISASFLSWLTVESQRSDLASDRKRPKGRVLDQSTDDAYGQFSPVLSTLAFDVSDSMDFVESSVVFPSFVSDVKLIVDGSREMSLAVIDGCIQNSDILRLDSILDYHTSVGLFDMGASAVQKPSLATQLMRSFTTLKHKDEGTTRLIVKWVPKLTASLGSPELYLSLFGDEQKDGRTSHLDELATRCALTWTAEHVATFVDWVLAESTPPPLSFSRVVRFVVDASGALSVHNDGISDSTALSNVSHIWRLSPAKVAALASMAISVVGSIGKENVVAELCDRNKVNPSASLVIVIAGKDKESTCIVTDLILRGVTSEKQADSASMHPLETVLLRIYLLNPHWMNLGNEPVRTALLDAAQSYPQHWITWRTSFDDQIENMIDSLLSGEKRMARPLTDLSRSHPLLVLRLIPDIVLLLEDDAVVGGGRKRVEKVTGRAMGSPRGATVRAVDVNVTVRHWGYSFSEPLWSAFLDVVTSIPNELLFGTGLELGVLDFFAAFLKLLSVQLQLLSADKSKRLVEKLRDVFASFQGTNSSGWKSWLGTTMDEMGREVRHVLMNCNFITPQEAIESLKEAES
jgi:hypothetical protein